ncbi:mesoderm induction early response protein 1 isoform X2 [Sitophilus oryzae]|uniref:Mesoderm induction early response protein 1 isoform X2 n=1 Tax=Sitophilus oryzae TaxID=7048 RepID=A0A6J2XYM1_SITOR|nr:mesoderm induction early response protein 1 isoform X2 [Sitophilus oryzae]
MDSRVPNDTGEKSNSDNGSESPSKDKLFDPSIDMLVNDFDDERTLEEEEALAAGESSDPSAELSSLQKEGNMPLEELLALYGYSNAKEKESSSESELEEEETAQEVAQICEPLVEKERSPTPPKHSKLSLLYEPMADETEDSSRLLRSVSRISDDDEEDYESGPDDEEAQKIRKTIMVGGDYQAQIPEGLHYYDNAPPYENEDKLLWNPRKIFNKNVEEYLRKAHEISKPPIPKGTLLRDDEQALYLLQQCGHNTEEALRRLRMNAPPSSAVTESKDTLWSEEECRNFESGIRSFGKNFHQIQQNMD